MRVLCDTLLTSTIRKILETMVEIAEIVGLGFSPWSMSLKSVDAMGVSFIVCEIPVSMLTGFEYNGTSTVFMNISIRRILKLLKRSNSCSMELTIENNRLYGRCFSNPTVTKCTPVYIPCCRARGVRYVKVDQSIFTTWPSVNLPPSELHDIFIGLSVTGGTVVLCLDKEKLQFTSDFGTGRQIITIHDHGTGNQTIPIHDNVTGKQIIPTRDILIQDMSIIPMQDISIQDIPMQDVQIQDVPMQEIPTQDIPVQNHGTGVNSIQFERNSDVKCNSVHNRYIIKFLKPLCNLLSSASDACVYTRLNSLLIVRVEIHGITVLHLLSPIINDKQT